ncbi:peptidoglycan-binding protein [Pseudaestuariivita atlantica]|uniref:peptidoglycan-binding protein n=1 Tax=Pseudaestuariivita atlantica TaxID=1317121 RepID=UPI00067DB482|nr:peptidoglycan-binding protein [Pseudaestuariivita atlantica]
MALSTPTDFATHGIDRFTVNGDMRSARNQTMLSLIGNPRGNYDQECRWPTNQAILNQIKIEDVGPFKVSGLAPAVEALGNVMDDIKAEDREVYDALGTMGMLCCRLVRGSTSAISNHSWGTAIDVTLEGKLDKFKDGRVQKGLLRIYKIFQRHGFFWGAAFSREDSMHFEICDQLIRKWVDEGKITSGGGNVDNGVLDFGDRGPEVTELQQVLNLRLGLDLDTDGVFGPATRATVMEFQRQNGLTIDGVVGPNTAAALGIDL